MDARELKAAEAEEKLKNPDTASAPQFLAEAIALRQQHSEAVTDLKAALMVSAEAKTSLARVKEEYAQALRAVAEQLYRAKL